MTKVCTFRLDDITPDMDWNRFYRVKAIFDKYKVKPLIGVVPDNQDAALKCGDLHPDFWEYIRSLEKSGWLVAQHGYRHIYETRNSGLLGIKKASEFAGLPYEVQYEKLRCGREILQKHGVNVTIFMAPGHTYDRNTLKALKNLGFICVTDGYADVPYYAKGLLFVPCRSSRPRISGVMDTICLHCNEMNENDYRELENFLEKNNAHVIPFSETLEQLWYPRRLFLISIQEKRNLWIRRLKKFTAENEMLQEYMQVTYDKDVRTKRIKRITHLPMLLLAGKRNRKKRDR